MPRTVQGMMSAGASGADVLEFVSRLNQQAADGLRKTERLKD